MTRVAILGCGPAGLIAAHGIAQMGLDFAIFSRKRKSDLYGAQYLHRPIPGISDPLAYVTVDYQLRGTIEGYREKVYGRRIGKALLSSVEALDQKHEAWDIRDAYDRLWDMYQDDVVEADVSEPPFLDATVQVADLVISSVPAPLLCLRNHAFTAQQVWAAGEAEDRGIKLPYNCPENTVVCNGEETPAWYRMSNVFGVKTVEWPFWIQRPPVGHPSPVNKPLRTNCDCWGGIVRIGRYGKWEKGALSHEAYDIARDRAASTATQPRLI